MKKKMMAGGPSSAKTSSMMGMYKTGGMKNPNKMAQVSPKKGSSKKMGKKK